jgi:nitrite reductase/ring-hydroxylating ferredoxin subunit/uncharacterized membrane protein
MPRRYSPIDLIAGVVALDRMAGALRDAVHKVLPSGSIKNALHGVWLGHALHPALAQLPVGFFTASAALDVVGDQPVAARRLIGLGLLTSVPAATTGLADYAEGHEEQQRIGLVHAALNSAALGCYGASLWLRARDKSSAGIATGLVGCALSVTAAALGGDLISRHAMGANHAAEVPHTGPEDWQELGAVTEFAPDEPVRRMAGLISVVVVKRDSGFTVLHDRCSHMAAPLHEGSLETVAGEQCLVCPWHGSAFRLEDGAVVHGPAIAPQPVLDTEVRDGVLYAKVRTYPGVPAS